MYKHLLPLIFLFGFRQLVHAENPPEFDKAAQLYDQGKFAEAKQSYESLAHSGNLSASLFYNLGNTEFRLNHPGDAILNYERALALEPSQPEARANLAFAREKTGAKIEARAWIDYLFPPFGLNNYAVVAAIAGWAAVFSLVALLFKARSGALLFVTVAGFLVFWYAAGALWFFSKDRSLAVVTADHAKAQYEPVESSRIVDTLPVGSRVRILRERGVWIYCTLPDGNTAWIAGNSIEPVRLGGS